MNRAISSLRAIVSKGPTPQRLLVVDDDEDLTRLVRRAASIASNELEVDLATTAAEARRLLKSRRYAVVLVDYYLDEGERGVDLLRPARKSQPDAVIAMMSSIGREALGELTARSGPVELLAKPISAPLLHHFLHESLELPGMPPAHVAPIA